ncbi:sulfotransferase [Thalassobacillus devorans]|uniref:Sulfotransferase n=1 Tax=Thalassobacillus devorans TaxID=279813 RepID=A0ABQ1NXA2_9BACI|nr:sulfotransferase [Thalassobacillus devorans]NIK28619.1 hypothetical protein [Thalassobacillus devorans]GGC84820.1 sulfotransferase [Thalassobacillus devorans]
MPSDEAKVPNLFMVGAAKSATTSIYNYLKKHPEIFFSDPKEPRYLSYKHEQFPHNGPNGEYYDSTFIKTKEDYMKLFKEAANEKVIGEASIQYLYFPDIALDIKELYPDAKIIICLRNPIDRSYSSYMHNVRSGYENLSFYDALQKEEERINQNYPFLWHYKEVGLYYKQVKKYLEVLGKDNVKIVLYEDINNNTQEVLQDICEFLGVNADYEFQDAGQVYNRSGKSSNPVINYLIKQNLLKKIMKHPRVPKFIRNTSYTMYHQLLTKFLKKEKMHEKERAYLKEYYKRDVLLLGDLIKRDTAHWIE